MELLQGLLMVVGVMLALGVGVGLAARVAMFIIYLGRDL